ncbi:hypothetical protein PUMCH_002299 [Australozyma saopauloensis]|uniref:Mitochondrial intermediate peptidase n=1 Tax=Australozyma saopauloensis TaxID=291208 RepID=A0AAX4H8W4_9ASCO|nr:hypothetical protein PUMCH_002299 [[Candida] saopauloensis]
MLLKQHTLLRRHAALQIGRQFHKTTGSDRILKLFDSPKYFANFNQSDRLVFSLPNVGLFRNEKLTSPDGLISFSKGSLKKAKELVRTMLLEAKNTDVGKLSYIRKLDQLSDTLCRVIDVAEFIRVAHPSQKWVEAAQQTHEIMFEYMNQLNTNVELYETLVLVLDLHLRGRLSDEEIEVGNYLRQDFERSGIAMDPTTRESFVAITQEISLLGSLFNNEIHNLPSFWVNVDKATFESSCSAALKRDILDLQMKAPLASLTEVSIPLAGHYPFSVLSTCSSEDIRKQVWIALHDSSKDQIATLNGFLKYRAFLAKMLGYKSFADYQLEHKMAKTPENVVTFLRNVQKHQLSEKSDVIKELRSLYKFKDESHFCSSDETILNNLKPWDRDYLLEKQSQANEQDQAQLEDISPYLSIGTVMSGLDKIFKSIYNVSLVPEQTHKGETWDQTHVRKLSYKDLETNETLGYLYVDFWSDKVLPSHFTIACSRELNLDLSTESSSEIQREVHLSNDGTYQLPVISLVCNFSKTPAVGSKSQVGAQMRRLAGLEGDYGATLLSLEQVSTIFHEMGHATHSMLARTKLHNLSGTRCLTDFVELPSVLMELFSVDPRVLCRIAKHYQTGEHLPEDLLKAHREKLNALQHTETYMQSKMALLDQVLHGDIVPDFSDNEALERFDSTLIYHNLEKDLKVFADKWSTWHGKFPHLFSYGAVYYSYLFDRAIADRLWNGLFKKDPWSRAAGEKYKQSILKWGGTRDPWLCLADALDEEQLAKGDANAMAIIGGSKD